ncbi:MAG: hypothetical protein HQL17_00405 [Candidatus Omnitrophica bacterium]|nr:hypothetical protein [Candidatus Omnitrophota bacterium]
MPFSKPLFSKAQTMIEYVLVMVVVAAVVFGAFTAGNNGMLHKTQNAATQYFDTGAAAIMGGYYEGGQYVELDPKPINGAWCLPCPVIGGVQVCDCACPRPAFGGTPCTAVVPPPPPCVPDCSAGCGDNGCGGSCGICPPPPPPPACVPDCVGKSCGANGCGGSCGTCPTGVCNISGQCVCMPNCAGKSCGDDGCGGTCGSCAFGSCNGSGQCVCTPNCGGKACGDDGCGGTCGICPSGPCDEATGTCVTWTVCQCATPSCTVWCSGNLNDGNGNILSCSLPAVVCAGNKICNTTSGACEDVCLTNVCGDNGHGGSCGTCEAGMDCLAGQCVPHCVPDWQPCECTTAYCSKVRDGVSSDKCGHTQTCNCYPVTCPQGQVCNTVGDGLCMACPSDACTGKECGSDGCGGSCGTCGDGMTCTGDKCIPLCVPNWTACDCTAACNEGPCTGLASDGCGHTQTCNNWPVLCTIGNKCDASGKCVSCPSDGCAGKECGYDACGSSCGSCPTGSCNVSGKCVPFFPPVCGDGTCDSGIENCSNCALDCGTCITPPQCGDGVCNGVETCSTCSLDCGACPEECGICKPSALVFCGQPNNDDCAKPCVMQGAIGTGGCNGGSVCETSTGACLCPATMPFWDGGVCRACSAVNVAMPYWNGSACVSCDFVGAGYIWDGTACRAP